eukprot:gene6340-11772_t
MGWAGLAGLAVLGWGLGWAGWAGCMLGVAALAGMLSCWVEHGLGGRAGLGVWDAAGNCGVSAAGQSPLRRQEKANEKINLLNDIGSKSKEGSPRRSRKYLQTRPASTCCRGLKESSLWQLMKIRNVQLSLALYAVFSFIATGFDETFPVYADSSKIYGGLGFASNQIGTATLIAAAPLVVLVFFIARFLIAGLYLLVLIMPLFAFIGYLPSRYVWFALIPFLFIVRLTFACCSIVINVTLNSAADPKYMGLVNGLGMIASCVFRSIAPALLGSLYSWSLTNEGTLGYPFNHHFSFVLTGFAALITLVIAVFLPDQK